MAADGTPKHLKKKPSKHETNMKFVLWPTIPVPKEESLVALWTPCCRGMSNDETLEGKTGICGLPGAPATPTSNISQALSFAPSTAQRVVAGGSREETQSRGLKEIQVGILVAYAVGFDSIHSR